MTNSPGRKSCHCYRTELKELEDGARRTRTLLQGLSCATVRVLALAVVFVDLRHMSGKPARQPASKGTKIVAKIGESRGPRAPRNPGFPEHKGARRYCVAGEGQPRPTIARTRTPYTSTPSDVQADNSLGVTHTPKNANAPLEQAVDRCDPGCTAGQDVPPCPFSLPPLPLVFCLLPFAFCLLPFRLLHWSSQSDRARLRGRVFRML